MTTEQETEVDETSEDFNLDTGDRSADSDKTQQGSAKTKKILMIVLVVLISVSVVCYYFIFSDEPAQTNSPKIDVKAVKEEPSEIEVKKKALYLPIENDFIATLVDEGGDEHHMVITVTLMVRENESLKAIEKNKPLIINNLLEVFESQNYQKMQQLKSKEALREKALIAIRESMKSEVPAVTIESVLFTKFMMD